MYSFGPVFCLEDLAAQYVLILSHQYKIHLFDIGH